MLDVQKASVVKRISAYLFDFILMTLVVVGVAALLAGILKYDSYTVQLREYYEKYEQQYGVDTQEYLTKENPTEEETKKYNELISALDHDEGAVYALSMIVYMGLTILSSSLLIGHILLEIVIPLLLKNGQTLGKKIFGICLMHKDGVRVSVTQVCLRALLGKYTVEVMLPLVAFLLFMMGMIGTIGLTIPVVLFIAQLLLVLASPVNCAIHDRLCNTVVVDYSSQMIFDCVEDMIDYKAALSAEMASRQEY